MVSLDKLRRIALDRQGLLQRAPFGSGLAGTRRAIEHLGYVQIDTISVVNRAHEHILQTRVPGFRPQMLETLQAEGGIFEYWAHAAAYLPMRDFRYALPRMNAMRAREERWIRSRDDALMDRVLHRIRAEGPLQTRDFGAPDPGVRGGWWDWKPAKRALEQLFMQGDLMISGRTGFRKVYDLTERVLPSGVDLRTPSTAEYADYLIRQQLRAHGFASIRDCVYQRPTPGLKAAVAEQLLEARHHGNLVALERGVGKRADADTTYIEATSMNARAPSAPVSARLLSPFDNAVIQRRRGRGLFGFDYQLECYLPPSRRRFGYFCLPLLYRDGFIGRADCKAHRQERRLEVRHLFFEHPQQMARDGERALAAVAGALARLADHNQCHQIQLGEVSPAPWRTPLAKACNETGREIP